MNPLQMSEAIPAENEMIKVLDTSLMQVQESFLALCDSLLQSLEQLVHSKQSRDDVVGLELDLQIRRLKEDIYLELKRWKETKHVFFRMCEDYLNSNRFEDARNLADNGGVLGNVYDELLCRYLPLLLGCFYLDDEYVNNSDQEVKLDNESLDTNKSTIPMKANNGQMKSKSNLLPGIILFYILNMFHIALILYIIFCK